MTGKRFAGPMGGSHERASEPSSEDASWTRAQRLAFRFAFVYLSLFCLATQIAGSMLPNLSVTFRGMGALWPMRGVTEWVAGSLLGITAPLDAASRGEPLFFWIQTSWILVVALVAAAAWSAIDRQRAGYTRLNAWFRFFLRLALAAALFEYGMTKVIPTQFPAPPLATLVTPAGHLTLSALLWTSMGASPAYQIFTGCVEVIAAILLLVPRTATLGAVIGVAALGQVLALNLTYDIGLKLISMHLIVLALIVVGPDLRALADFFVRRRPAHASTPALPVSARAARRLLAAQLAFGAYLLGMYGYINWSFWEVAGGGQPRSALYGIWDVERLSVDGEVRAPELNDYDRRWKRAIFDEADAVVFQRTDDSLARYGASIDRSSGTLVLTKGNSRTWSARFTFERAAPDRLMIAGEMDGHRLEAELQQVDFDAFPLLHSRFRWVRPHD